MNVEAFEVFEGVRKVGESLLPRKLKTYMKSFWCAFQNGDFMVNSLKQFSVKLILHWFTELYLLDSSDEFRSLV